MENDEKKNDAVFYIDTLVVLFEESAVRGSSLRSFYAILFK